MQQSNTGASRVSIRE